MNRGVIIISILVLLISYVRIFIFTPPSTTAIQSERPDASPYVPLPPAARAKLEEVARSMITTKPAPAQGDVTVLIRDDCVKDGDCRVVHNKFCGDWATNQASYDIAQSALAVCTKGGVDDPTHPNAFTRPPGPSSPSSIAVCSNKRCVAMVPE